MTPLRISIAVVLAVLVLFVGGCLVYGLGTSEDADLDDPLTTPTQTKTTP